MGVILDEQQKKRPPRVKLLQNMPGLREPRIIQSGRKCCMESTALTAETEKASKNRFCKIIHTRIQFRKKWLCQEGFLGKPVNYVYVKASEKSYLEVVQPCMKTYTGGERKGISTAITQAQSASM